MRHETSPAYSTRSKGTGLSSRLCVAGMQSPISVRCNEDEAATSKQCCATRRPILTGKTTLRLLAGSSRQSADPCERSSYRPPLRSTQIPSRRTNDAASPQGERCRVCRRWTSRPFDTKRMFDSGADAPLSLRFGSTRGVCLCRQASCTPRQAGRVRACNTVSAHCGHGLHNLGRRGLARRCCPGLSSVERPRGLRDALTKVGVAPKTIRRVGDLSNDTRWTAPNPRASDWVLTAVGIRRRGDRSATLRRRSGRRRFRR